jgi:phage-related protein
VTVSTGSATFRDNARSEAGYELNEIQIGNDPDNWKPMKTVGPGFVKSGSGKIPGLSGFIYLARLLDAVLSWMPVRKRRRRDHNGISI